MPLSLTELGGQKCLYEIPGHCRSDGSSAQLIGFIQSKFSALEISVVHQDISKLEVNEAEVEYDASAPPAEIAREITSNDSRSVMEEVADALSKFSR